MPSRRKKKAYEDEVPELPNPGDKGAEFLGWLRKHGFIYPFAECNNYCCSIDLDLKQFVREMGRERIVIGRTGNGDIAVKLSDKNWSGKWARKYGYELPHHRHKKTLREIKL